MTTEEREAISAYIREVADQLGMKDWRVELSDDRPDEASSSAQVVIAYGMKRAKIRIGENWDTDSPDERRNTIVHELVHCHIDAIEKAFMSVRQTMGRDAYEVARDSVRDAVEWATDAIATAIDPFFPLPPTGIDEKEP